MSELKTPHRRKARGVKRGILIPPTVPHVDKMNNGTLNRLSRFSSAMIEVRDGVLGFSELVAQVKNPVDSSHATNLQEAKLGLAVASSSGSARKTLVAVIEHDGQTVLWVDLDECSFKDPSEIAEIIKTVGIESFVIYTTLRHTPKNPRYRVVIELAELIDLELWVALQTRLAKMLGGDTCALKPSQVFFLPARGPGGYAYYVNEGSALRCYRQGDDQVWFDPQPDTDSPFIAEAWSEHLREKELKRGGSNPKRATPLPDGSVDIIARCNEDDLEEYIENLGFELCPNGAYLHPKSTSGIAGIRLFYRDGKLVSYSHHSRETDPLADGFTHDLFDWRSFYEFGGFNEL
ncbi:MAG: hypothetical protein IPM37_23360 [Hahellaceae bacterium]|nr:hypothetical protein [Hahellaceae bacterium]